MRLFWGYRGGSLEGIWNSFEYINYRQIWIMLEFSRHLTAVGIFEGIWGFFCRVLLRVSVAGKNLIYLRVSAM